MLLPRGTALLVVVVSTAAIVGERSSFSGDFRLDFFEKQHPILAFQWPPDQATFSVTMFGFGHRRNRKEEAYVHLS